MLLNFLQILYEGAYIKTYLATISTKINLNFTYMIQVIS